MNATAAASGSAVQVEQVRLLPGRSPASILYRAVERERPSKVFVLFSGGKDSSVTLDYLWRHHGGIITGALHIVTGIGLQSTHDFVRSFCADRGIPLYEAAAPPGEYEAMVREHGFPGPGAHRYPYIRLKERALDRFIAEQKQHRMDRIGLITGVRIAESKRRMGTCRDIRRDGAQVWIATHIDWSNAEMASYRAEHAVPMSPASELLHLSAECLCGGMADDPSELVWIEACYGDDPAVLCILALQDELRAIGHPRSRWGEKVENPEEPVDPGMTPLCFDCAQASA